MSAIGTALKRSMNVSAENSEEIANSTAGSEAEVLRTLRAKQSVESKVDSSIDSTALTQLLAELNSHSLALVPYRQPRTETGAARAASAFRLESVLLWMLTTVLLAVVFSTLTIKYLISDRNLQAAAPRPTLEVLGPSTAELQQRDQQQKQFANLADALVRLTAASTSSNTRMSRIEAGQARLLRRSETPAPVATTKTVRPTHVADVATSTATPTPTPSAPPPAPAVPVAAAPAVAITAPASTLAESSITGIEMIRGAVEHRSASGVTDYWLAPRSTGGSTRMVKVRPFATSLKGVWVHNLDEGQDYVLSPSGGWISEGSVPPVTK
jgi:hypothetical protein